MQRQPYQKKNFKQTGTPNGIPSTAIFNFMDSDRDLKIYAPQSGLSKTLNNSINENKMEEESMGTHENDIATDPLSIDVNLYSIKQEIQDTQSQQLLTNLCDEDWFNEPPNDIEAVASSKNILFGRLILNISENGRTFLLICNQCKKSFLNIPDFDAHIKRNQLNPNNIECEQIVKKEKSEPEQLNPDKIESSDISSSDTEIEAYEKKETPSKTKRNFNLPFSIDHPDRACVITFLELLKVHPILWLKSRSNIVYTRKARNALLEKLNEQYPKYKMTNKELDKTINHFRNFYERTVATKSCEVGNDTKKRFKVKNDIEYFELCMAIEINSKEIIQKCDICKTIFYEAHDLQIHKYRIHKIGDSPFKCLRCNYGFSTAEALKSHEEKHNRSKNFKCEICGQGFYLESKLQAHMTLHTDDSKHVCETCGKKFPSLSKYRRHKLHHEPPKEKCEICGKLYFEKWTLSEHMKSHRNERQYKCYTCGKTFNRQEDVTIHKRRVHKISMPQNDEDNNTNEEIYEIMVNEEALQSSDVKPILTNNFNQQQMFPLETLNSFLN